MKLTMKFICLCIISVTQANHIDMDTLNPATKGHTIRKLTLWKRENQDVRTAQHLKGDNSVVPMRPKNRRRGLVPNWRRRGDLGLNNARRPRHIGLNPQTVVLNFAQLPVERPMDGPHRRRRYDYEDEAQWAIDEGDYNTLVAEAEKDSDFEKFAKSWQKHTLKFMFIFSFCTMILCCCCACCKRMFTRLYEVCCMHCRDWRDICLNRDPSFRRARQFADDYGIKLDYEQYKNIKTNFEAALDEQGHGKVDLSGR